jgi:hypothetical protein
MCVDIYLILHIHSHTHSSITTILLIAGCYGFDSDELTQHMTAHYIRFYSAIELTSVPFAVISLPWALSEIWNVGTTGHQIYHHQVPISRECKELELRYPVTSSLFWDYFACLLDWTLAFPRNQPIYKTI